MMTQSMKGAGRGHTLLRTLDEAEEADDEYELTFSDPAEFAEAHRSFILFRSKSPTKDKESNFVEDPDEILAALPINNRPSNGLVAPSGWDPLPSPPQARMLTCFCILCQCSMAPPFYGIVCAPPSAIDSIMHTQCQGKWVLQQGSHSQQGFRPRG